IEVVLTQSQERHRLTRAQAIRVDAAGEQIQPLDFDPFAFVRGLSPADRSPMRRYVHLVREAQPIAYWRFESLDAGGVVNEMDSRYRAEVIGHVRLDEDGWNRGAILGESGEGYLFVREPLDALRSTAEYTFEFWVEATRYNHATVLVLAAGNPDEDEA